jgi:excisionase family DNA binding protein
VTAPLRAGDHRSPRVSPVTGRLLSMIDAASLLALKPATLRAWAASGRIEVVHLGRAVRVPSSEVDRLIVEGFVPRRDSERR